MKEARCQATQEGLCAQFRAMCKELMVWREGHPGASWDEIAAQVTPRRRQLMGELLEALALQEGNGRCPEGIVCEHCGLAWSAREKLPERWNTRKGRAPCSGPTIIVPTVVRGFSPLDRQLKLVRHSWTPEMIQEALRLGSEIPSLRRAARSVRRLTRVPPSKSSLEALIAEYGGVWWPCKSRKQRRRRAHPGVRRG